MSNGYCPNCKTYEKGIKGRCPHCNSSLKKPDYALNYKAVIVVAIILVSAHLIGLSGGYQFLGETFQKIPVSIIEPSMSEQCKKAIRDYNELKEFLGVGDTINFDTKTMAWSDFQKYRALKDKIFDLNCSLEPDT